MGDVQDGGYSENQLVEIGGFIFVCNISACWQDGRYIARKDFTEDMSKALSKHHGETLSNRIKNIGE